MEAVEFVVPVHTEDLELPNKDGNFYVRTVLDVEHVGKAKLSDLLDDATERLFGAEGVFAITENDVFDPLYSMLRGFPLLDSTAQTRVIDLLSSSLSACLPLVASSESGEGSASAVQRRTVFKMLCFLACTGVLVAEKFSVHANKMAKNEAANSGKPTGRGRRKPAASSSGFTWEPLCVKSLQSILDALNIDFGHLWSCGVAEEAFVNVFTKMALRAMENPTHMSKTNAKTSDVLIRIVATCGKKFTAIAPSLTAALSRMIHSFEHVGEAMAELLRILSAEMGDQRISGDIVREVGHVETDTKNSSSLRNVAGFLCALSQRLPKLMLSQVSVLLPLLDGDSYSIRSAVVQSLAHIVAHGFAEDDAATPDGEEGAGAESQERAAKSARARDALLDVMQERVYDAHAFTRATVMKAFAQLVEDSALPLDRVHQIVTLCTDRMHDKAAAVRKCALSTLTTMLERNPFGADLRVEPYQEELKKLDAWLAENGPKTAGDVEEKGQEDADDTPGDEEVKVTEEQLHHLRARDYCFGIIKFAEQMGAALPVVAKMLGSKNSGDSVESMRFLSKARAFHVPGALESLRKMLTLIWTETKAVREEVLATFLELYVYVPGTSGRKKQPPQQIARNLVTIVSGSTLAVRTSLEEVVRALIKEKKIPRPALKCLWEMSVAQADGSTDSDVTVTDSRYALSIIAMAAAAEPAIVDTPARLTALGEAALSGAARKACDYRIAKHACVALQKATARQGSSSDAISATTAHIAEFIRGDWDDGSVADEHWFSAAEQGIITIFAVESKPEQLCQQIIRHMARTSDTSSKKGAGLDSASVARMCFVLGHVAVKLLVHTESLASRAKKARQAATDKAAKEAAEAVTGGADEEKDSLADELGMNGIDEEADANYLRDISEKQLVCNNLLGSFGEFLPKLVAATAVAGNGSDYLLRQSALLALCKFMSVSGEYCSKNLQLLFTVLQNSPEASLRATIAIALGDLAFRFPNLLEPWTHHLYMRLRDEDARVRKNTLMVLTHLILNDMIKVRGQVAEIAVCLEDKDERIRDLTHLFFHELSKRGHNPIYNVLPDTLGQLSRHPGVTPDCFRTIMKFLIAFIAKDKQTEALVDKFCQRFETTEDAQQWRDIAFCLAHLKMNEKSIKKMMDNVRMYKAALIDDSVAASIESIVAKAKKITKPEFKALISTWQDAMQLQTTEDADSGAAKELSQDAEATDEDSISDPAEATDPAAIAVEVAV